MNSTQRSLRNRILDKSSVAIFDALVTRAHRMPFPKRVEWFAHVMSTYFAPIAGYQKRAEENLALIFPEMTANARRQTAKNVLENFGRTLIEFYSPIDFKAHIRTGGSKLEGEGLSHLHQARNEGRPILMVAGHFGNYLASACLVSDMGYPVGGLYRPFTNPLFDDRYRNTLAKHLDQVFPQGPQGTFAFNKHLLGGGLCAIFTDVNEPGGELVDFMGVPAPTAVSAARLALRTNALVLPFFDIRQEDGITFQSIIEAPIEHTTPVQMTKEITDRLTKRVLDNPEQWFWVHRRWRNNSL